MMLPFDFQPVTRIVFGPDALDRLGELARELGARRALVVSDAGIIAAGHTPRGVETLRRAGIAAEVFGSVRENPTTDDVDAGVARAREFAPDLLIGLGGGSSLDCAKGINFVHTNGGPMRDYWGVGKAPRAMLPMIAIPTTAGTGSETQSFALISDAKTKEKMACGDKKAACRIALLDPKLTLTQPPRVTALTGMDALAHALETYVTKRRNEISLVFSREAWRLLAGNFVRVLENPADLNARGGMQLGASLAGWAIENSMLGAAHALANPLTARYGIVHGEAVGMMLPHVIRFNGEAFPDWYRDVLAAGGPGDRPARSPVDQLAEFVEESLKRAGLATHLSERGVLPSDVQQLSQAAAKQWTGSFNPRPVGAAELERLYRQAL